MRGIVLGCGLWALDLRSGGFAMVVQPLRPTRCPGFLIGGVRSAIVYNDRITLRGVPEEAYRYMLGSRSAIEWIMERYQVKVDKASQIRNDPNDWSREVGNPRYILDLLARIVTVSLETMRIVDALPAMEVLMTQEND